MVRFLELTRWRSAAAVAAIVLAGCSSNGKDTVLSAVLDEVSPGEETEQASNPAESISRAQIDRLGVALIRVHATKTADQNLLVAFRQSGHQVTYVLRSERRLVMHGGLIQSTYGFGDNLAPLGVHDQDPIAFPKPARYWPALILRDYELSDRGVGEPTTVSCGFRFGPEGVLNIVDRDVVVQTVWETCSGNGIEFTNRYDVDPSSGAIWRSRQWTGNTQGHLIYEVLEPLD